MNRDSVIDYVSYILFRTIGALLRVFPASLTLFLGRRIGDMLYYINLRRRSLVYANLRQAFSKEFSSGQLKKLTKEFYRNFGANLLEVFLIPKVNDSYIRKFITVEGREHIEEAFRKNKGVILLGMHAGSWELSNVICANLGFSLNLLVREQKMPRLNALLNSYRSLKGCRLIQRQDQTRGLIEALKRNEAVGMTVDQGGKEGLAVNFFGKEASMATGALRLALKHDAVILPGYYVRLKGPYMKVIIEKPFELKKTGDIKTDLAENLSRLIPVYEKDIRAYPKEYMWSYRIWKYSPQKNILILSDSRAGHLRQSQAAAKQLSELLKDSGYKPRTEIVPVSYRSPSLKTIFSFASLSSGKYNCQGCLSCLRRALAKDLFSSLTQKNPDFIISCGSALAPVNYLLSRESLAKSVVIMRPGMMGLKRFDLVVMPKHDRPPRKKNVLATEASLNLIDTAYLKDELRRMAESGQVRGKLSDSCIGLLLGGDTKNFSLDARTAGKVLDEIKHSSQKLDMDILASTSRRTSKEAEDAVKKAFSDCPRCKLLVIANENNFDFAVGGILAASSVAVVSPESISMISEAAASNKYVIVFEGEGLSKKHRRFLEDFCAKGRIHIVRPENISAKIEELMKNKPALSPCEDNLRLREALKKII